jgi:hypothetical protein
VLHFRFAKTGSGQRLSTEKRPSYILYVATQAMGASINFPVMCGRSVYTKAQRTCEINFAHDFPHRQQELRVNRDYAGGASFNAPKGQAVSPSRRRRRSGKNIPTFGDGDTGRRRAAVAVANGTVAQGRTEKQKPSQAHRLGGGSNLPTEAEEVEDDDDDDDDDDDAWGGGQGAREGLWRWL